MGRMTEFEQGNLVMISKPLDLYYECNGKIKGYNQFTGEYHVEMLSGDAKHDILPYSGADLALSSDDY